MAGQGAPTVADVIQALLLCGLLGVLGQGVRAIVLLKNAGSLNSTTPGEQAVFSLAYLALSLMIGFIAGALAGIALNLETIITVDPSNWKLLVGIAGSGYIGADFIENAMSVVIPGTKPTRAKARSPTVESPPIPTATPLPPRVSRKPRQLAPQTEGVKALTTACGASARRRMRPSGRLRSSRPSTTSVSRTTDARRPLWANFLSRRGRR
jgi:hypothetical protein